MSEKFRIPGLLEMHIEAKIFLKINIKFKKISFDFIIEIESLKFKLKNSTNYEFESPKRVLPHCEMSTT